MITITITITVPTVEETRKARIQRQAAQAPGQLQSIGYAYVDDTEVADAYRAAGYEVKDTGRDYRVSVPRSR